MGRQVDAALDLSHTQNIGHMIKTHFPFSQFIVVSLKEGMFNNANVIFRTKFMDGVSAVTRTTNDARRCVAVTCCMLSLLGGAYLCAAALAATDHLRLTGLGLDAGPRSGENRKEAVSQRGSR